MNHGQLSEIQRRNMAIWLLLICAVIFSMISLGGVTRLTGSGLSMVEWAPITGLLPPLNEFEWNAVFALYQDSPEYIKVNTGLDLAGFKSIFWFEYVHRLLGRAIGMLFFLPMLYFFARYPLPLALRLKLLGLFVLGGAQGLMGWYMVKSGLVNDPQVSQYRLVAHLSLALILYAVIFWMGSVYFVRHWTQRYVTPKGLCRTNLGLLALVVVTILAGGFVAGTDAGFAFNTFPLMNGKWVPEAYGVLTPLWLNWFENIAAVQFNHRLIATLTLIWAGCAVWWALKVPLLREFRRLFVILAGMLVLQYSLGVLTLINVVPVALGAIHQAVAVLALTVILFVVRVQVHLAR